MNYPIMEHEHEINGVKGRMFTIHEPVNGLHLNQKWRSFSRPIEGYGTNGQMTVEIRFDDQCRNGHQTFSITADVYTNESRRQRDIAACGCLHEDIEKVFPELAPLIKWHLVSTDGPLHYIANTLHHAGDKDCWGLKKGEKRQIRNGKTGQLCWKLEFTGEKGPQYIDSDTEPPAPQGEYKYVPRYRTGEGKERDLKSARSCAVWPEATDEELTSEDLEEKLKARLPRLMEEFKKAMVETCGFLWAMNTSYTKPT
jgi:hypothetical protein